MFHIIPLNQVVFPGSRPHRGVKIREHPLPCCSEDEGRERLRGTKLSLCRNALALLCSPLPRSPLPRARSLRFPERWKNVWQKRPSVGLSAARSSRLSPRSAPRTLSTGLARLLFPVLAFRQKCYSRAPLRPSVRPSFSPPPLPHLYLFSSLRRRLRFSTLLLPSLSLSVCSRIVNPSLKK